MSWEFMSFITQAWPVVVMFSHFSPPGLPMCSWSLARLFSGTAPFRNASWLWQWRRPTWAVTPGTGPSSPPPCSSWPDTAFWSSRIWTWLPTGLPSQVQAKLWDTFNLHPHPQPFLSSLRVFKQEFSWGMPPKHCSISFNPLLLWRFPNFIAVWPRACLCRSWGGERGKEQSCSPHALFEEFRSSRALFSLAGKHKMTVYFHDKPSWN